ncbi:calcyphosin-like protein isoform X2 [Fopius arisanus]|uniref:Calcyphosin-like protein isoform X2 n=1 Tax=Fopius arisanus TaxID=64838 RepID=A0A9R1TKJ7_9HYME|nr:PREDICTED: calcyphosin-like protein isoform X2 [Fopius arisanus]
MFHRPVSATTRQEAEMVNWAQRAVHGATDSIEKLRLLCLARGANGILGLARVFRRMDEDGNKQLSKEELTDGLTEVGFELDEGEIDELMSKLDGDGNGSIDLTEFIAAVRPPMSENRRKVVHQAFQKLDKTGDGGITYEDLRGVYNVKCHPRYISGEESEESIMNKFLGNFEQEATKDGIVSEKKYYFCTSSMKVFQRLLKRNS